jgi:transcriptional regulator of acetoin/glycerol metabolism
MRSSGDGTKEIAMHLKTPAGRALAVAAIGLLSVAGMARAQTPPNGSEIPASVEMGHADALSHLEALSRHPGRVGTIARETLAAMKRYAWPGNVRELRHVLECAVLLASGGVIRPDALPPRVTAARRSTPPAQPVRSADVPPKLRGELEAIEQRRILEALERCAGNQTRAAKVLGIGRRTLLKRLDEYGISRPRRRAE